MEITLIAILGYLPQFSHCAHCQAPLLARDADDHLAYPPWLGFSASLGGALCPACLATVPGAKRITAGTLQVAQLLLTRGVDCMDGLQLSDRLRRELEGTLRDYLEYRLERRLQSSRFMRDWGDGVSEQSPACEVGSEA